MKSCSTFMVSEKANTATRSAGCHLLVDKLQRRGLRAVLILWRHGAHIEVERHQAAVAVPDVARRLGRDLGLGNRLDYGTLRCRRRCLLRPPRKLRLDFIDLLKLAEADGLWGAVFGDSEIFGRQAFHRIAALI